MTKVKFHQWHHFGKLSLVFQEKALIIDGKCQVTPDLFLHGKGLKEDYAEQLFKKL